MIFVLCSFYFFSSAIVLMLGFMFASDLCCECVSLHLNYAFLYFIVIFSCNKNISSLVGLLL